MLARSTPTSFLPLLLVSLALEASAVDHTVCPSGCDFPSPAACAIGVGVANGDRCLVLGGEYHETVAAMSGALKTDLIVECAAGETCIIDGDGLREHGFEAYQGWRVRGFEVTETTGHAITGLVGRELAEVSDCFIHDVHGRGINSLAAGGVAERNIVERVGDFGIFCGTSDSGRIVRNNLVLAAGLFGGYGILCANGGDTVVHNTVDQRTRTAEFFDTSAYGILASEAYYNVVAGANVAIQATVASDENLAFGASSSDYGAAMGLSDAVGDPLFFGIDDHHLQAGSPAIDTAVSSIESQDIEGRPRIPPPDKGAYESDPAHVGSVASWPIRERVASLVDGTSVSLALDEQKRPAIVFVDIDAQTIEYAVRDADTGAWMAETIDPVSGITTGASVSPDLRYADLGVLRPSNRPVAVWLEQNGGTWELRHAERIEHSGDCADPAWSGCTAPAVASLGGAAAASLRLAVSEVDGRLAVAVWRSGFDAGCGGAPGDSLILYEKPPAGGWQSTIVATECVGNLGRGIAVGFEPGSGNIELAYYHDGSLQLAVDPPGGPLSSSSVPLDPAQLPLGFSGNSYLALAHSASGTRLGIAYGPITNTGAEFGLAMVERVGGVWNTTSDWVAYLTSGSVIPLASPDVAYDGEDPVVAYAGDRTLSLSWRSGTGDWDSEFVDSERFSGYWASLALGPSGEILVAHQDARPGYRDPKLHATALPAPPPASVPMLSEGALLVVTAAFAGFGSWTLRNRRRAATA